MTQVQVSWASVRAAAANPDGERLPARLVLVHLPARPGLRCPFPLRPVGAGGLGPVTPRQYRLLNGSGRPLADPVQPARDRARLRLPSPQPGGRFAGPLAGLPGSRRSPASGAAPASSTPPAATWSSAWPRPSPAPSTPRLSSSTIPRTPSDFRVRLRLEPGPQADIDLADRATVNVIEGTGTPLRYRLRDPGTNLYLGPGGSNDALQFNSDDQTWTQTQPDGFEVNYDSSGRTSYLATPAGDRWTVSYDGGNRVTAITDPFARATAFAYDAAWASAQIQQPDGRVTSLTVDGSGNLVGCVYPDDSRVTLAYNGHQLTSFTDPRGQATVYYYDASGRVSLVTTPAYEQTTYEYLPGGITGGPTRVSTPTAASPRCPSTWTVTSPG